MSRRTTKRKLTFEMLETKCTPSAALLALAPLDDSFHFTLEQARDVHTPGQLAESSTYHPSNWQFQISTTVILEFVHQHSGNPSSESSLNRPTSEQCRSADEMMKLGDQDLRVLVISDSLQTNG